MFAAVHSTQVTSSLHEPVVTDSTEAAMERFKAKGGTIKHCAIGEHTLTGDGDTLFEDIDGEGFLQDGD